MPAVRKAVAENDEEDPSYKTVCFDSSWKNVGHNFLNNILATFLGTGEVLQIEIMNKFCFGFHTNLTSKHKCEKNYERSSDGMESAGVLDFSNYFLHTKLDLNLRKKLVKCYVWSMSLYGAETWTLRATDQKRLESFKMW